MAPHFHRAVFSDAMNDNGLLVLARGLGLRDVVAKFLRLFSSPSNLVFVLNATSDAEWYTAALTRDGELAPRALLDVNVRDGLRANAG